MIALLVMTDGRRGYLDRTIASVLSNVTGPIDEWWMHDDSGDPRHQAELRDAYPGFIHIQHDRRLGFTGAILAAWSVLHGHSRARHVFHLEADFVFRVPVDLGELAALLDARPYLVQVALRRQPWNQVERAAGGIVEMAPGAYHDCRDDAGRHWLEHRQWFTTNPCLYRASLLRLGWPRTAQSEHAFAHQLLTAGSPESPPDRVRFGLWGARESGEWVQHIGVERAGTDY